MNEENTGKIIFSNFSCIQHEKKCLILQSRIKFGSSCLFLYVGQVSERKPNDEKAYDYDYLMAELAEHRGVAIDLQTPKINESMENLKSYVLFQEFMDLLPQISEANAISLELNKVKIILLTFFQILIITRYNISNWRYYYVFYFIQ